MHPTAYLGAFIQKRKNMQYLVNISSFYKDESVFANLIVLLNVAIKRVDEKTV